MNKFQNSAVWLALMLACLGCRDPRTAPSFETNTPAAHATEATTDPRLPLSPSLPSPPSQSASSPSTPSTTAARLPDPDQPSEASTRERPLSIYDAPTAPRILRVNITGMDGRSGHCFAALYVRDGFNDPERAITKAVLELHDETLVWEVPIEDWLTSLNTTDLDTLPIAISVYHDKNDNGKLDKNSFGLPTERYGFSNDPARGFGPPRFPQTAMPLGPLLQNNAHIQIRLH